MLLGSTRYLYVYLLLASMRGVSEVLVTNESKGLAGICIYASVQKNIEQQAEYCCGRALYQQHTEEQRVKAQNDIDMVCSRICLWSLPLLACNAFSRLTLVWMIVSAGIEPYSERWWLSVLSPLCPAVQVSVFLDPRGRKQANVALPVPLRWSWHANTISLAVAP